MSKKTDETKENPVNLPKNIQQIGSAGNGIKVYLEDYSGTYVRRILSGEEVRHGILLGRKQTDSRQTYLFIRAVIEVKPQEKEPYWKYDWNQIYETMQRYFIEESGEKLEILGWAMSIEDYRRLDINELEQMHRCNFGGNLTLALLMDRQENREQFYILENDRFHSLNGYYIYYEKNKAMQTYVLENQPGPCVETEELLKGNRESYRTFLLRRKETMHKRQTMSLLYVASTFLVMVVVVLGITMMNNYEKMESMQDVISQLSKSVLNEEVSSVALQSDGENRIGQAKEHAQEQTAQAMSGTIMQEGSKGALQAAGEAPTTAVSGEAVQTVSASGTTASEYPDAGVEEALSPTPTPEPVKTTQPQSTAASSKKSYKVQLGDTLLGISLKLYGTPDMAKEICKYNDIEDGDQIVEGDVLLLP